MSAHSTRWKLAGRSALVLAATMLVAACSEQADPVQPETEATAAMSANGPPDIVEVLRRQTPALMSRSGIVGTGIRHQSGEKSIVVFAVSSAHAAAAAIPARLEGHDVDVEVTGLITTRDLSNPTTKERPAPNGFSVGHPDITAGTIGAKVIDAQGNNYILSNNHVLANSNAASIGDATYQPGPYDGGTAADQIGQLADFETIIMGGAENIMDAAIAIVNGADLTGATPDYAYGAPSATLYTGTVLNKSVQKFGRTTGHTTGTVTETNLTVSVCYVPRGFFACAESATFVDQIGITPGSFSAGGDSGSLIVTNDTNKQPVALLFAGSDTRTIGSPIGPIMDRFAITIDNTSGGTAPPPDPDPVDNPPSAAFSVSCSNNVCSFSDQSSDDLGVASWSWNFGDGATSTAQNPSHTYGSAGSYTVTLTVTDGIGQSDSATGVVSCSVRGKRVRCS